MNESVKIATRGVSFGLYRLMFWNKAKCCYVFPPFVENLTLRMGESVLRPHSLSVCRALRDDFLLRWPSACIIITPYPI